MAEAERTLRIWSVWPEKAVVQDGLDRIPLSDEQDFRRMEEEILEYAAQLDEEKILLNITGGTKLMSVAAQSIAQASGWMMFYVDVDSDQIIWLDKDNDTPPQKLHHQLRLRHYLQSYGFTFTKEAARPHANTEQQDLLRSLSTQVGSLQDALSTLNFLTQQAESERRLSVKLSDRQLDSRSLDVLLRYFEDAGSLQLKDNTIHFPSEDDRDFVKGGWLELYAMQTIQQVSGELDIRDKALGLEVIAQNGTKNELDIAFMTRNRLFVIECKTARIDRPSGNSSKPVPPKANDTLFKLAENCRRVGGLGTRGMLLSYRKLNQPELLLAHALNIEVVSGPDIAQLATRLKTWVSPQS